jgi:hypothetical protein
MLKTKVVHSKKALAWNVVNASLGGKYKIAIIPYCTSNEPEVLEKEKAEALEHAEFISYCLNNMNEILSNK